MSSSNGESKTRPPLILTMGSAWSNSPVEVTFEDSSLVENKGFNQILDAAIERIEDPLQRAEVQSLSSGLQQYERRDRRKPLVTVAVDVEECLPFTVPVDSPTVGNRLAAAARLAGAASVAAVRGELAAEAVSEGGRSKP